jgi:rubrerythrin
MASSNALEVIREAMHIEKEGMRFYRKVAKYSKDRKTAGLFKQLAHDELTHLERLEAVFNSLVENNEWMAEKDLMDVKTDVLKEKDLFDSDVSDEGGEFDEFDAVERGIKAEEDSIALYRKATQECQANGEQGGCAVFKWLLEFEKGHLKLLKERYRDIRAR